VAPPAGQIRPARYLAIFLFIVVFLYTLVFATGDHQAKPKLGIDLQGGTRVALTARTENGQEPSRESLDKARQIIETRVNGIGVSGAEVVLDGTQIVITVPGEGGDQAKALGQTARLYFREVIGQPYPLQQQPPSDQNQQQPPASSTAPAPPSPSAGSAPSTQPQGRPAPALAQPTTPTPDPNQAQPTDPIAACQKYVDDLQSYYDDLHNKRQPKVEVSNLITEAKACRQNPALAPSDDPASQPDTNAQQAAVASLLGCTDQFPDPLVGNDDPNLPLVACDEKEPQAYVLSKSFLSGTEIDSANSQVNDQGAGYIVTLNFKGGGGRTWADYTTKNVQKQAAFVLDTEVVSAPTIQEPITGGSTRITGGGGGFGKTEARDLANVLKYGSLPLSFEASEAETVSATLGLASLKAGLIAGAIGLLLVFVYCLFYYRLLGILTILSLALSAVIVYAILVLLGRWIGFTLDLAGIAGFIVAIGITADSFIIFFERLKDEVREGRSFRSAVPRGWVRARRTILSADAVSFLAAAVLYLLAVGQVRGFAFTLGMSTVLDLVVVFLVTHPLVHLASRNKVLSSPRWSGLGAMQRMAATQRTAISTAGKGA
jgi:preprotein translocase subunit SecD